MSKRLLLYFLGNGVFAALAWTAVAMGVEGAKAPFLFLLYLSATTVFFAAFSEVTKAALFKTGPTVPPAFDLIFDVCISALLLQYGWYWTAVVYLLHTLTLQGLWSEREKKEAQT